MKKIIVLGVVAFLIGNSANAQVQTNKKVALSSTEKKELKEVLKAKQTKNKMGKIKQQARKQD